jgi:energy-coupling factor transporter ATP-binding protein EcfA2
LAGDSLPVSFCAGRVRTWRKTLRTELGRASELSRAEQPHFLESLRFHLSQQGLVELEQYIQGELLDHRLGISDSAAYLKLAQLVEHHAVDTKASITKDTVATIVEEYATKRRLPQRFAVDRGSFVRLAAFSGELEKAVAQADGGYVVVTGPPGSGKSTSLSVFLDGLASDRFAVTRYYCFVELNEYHQHRRLEGETLLANLMSNLQEQFPDVLARRFDYSPEYFTASLSTLGKIMLAQGKRLVVLVDGLDHVERADAELHRSVIDALPKVVPKGVTFLLGTRELQRWPTFLQTGHAGIRPHLSIPLFGVSEVRDYLVGKHKLRLSAAQVRRIHQVSEGLPLYLRYIAVRLRQTGNVDAELDRLPVIPGGEVDTYYREIWRQFERRGVGEARHLCIVLAALRFATSEDDLRELQKQLAPPAFSEAFGAVKHLLRERNGKHLIFHGSFGEFVFAQVSAAERQSVYADIHTWFKSRVGTSLWYSHSFWYAYAARDYESLKRTVDLQFTDRAIFDLCPERHLLAAIDLAADAARDTEDLVTLARLGALKYRTAERWGQNIDCRLLARALSRLGRAEGLLRLVYDDNTDEWHGTEKPSHAAHATAPLHQGIPADRQPDAGIHWRGIWTADQSRRKRTRGGSRIRHDAYRVHTHKRFVAGQTPASVHRPVVRWPARHTCCDRSPPS